VLTILSGGQTGVDRGALDAALAAHAPCGGWCPERRRAEDGSIPPRYPLRELPGGGYPERTLANVRDSDATLVITFGDPEGGTLVTIEHARALGRPLLVLDAGTAAIADAADRISDWIAAHGITHLNVAGPRASKEPRARDYAEAVIRCVIARTDR
jgi:Circularly permutated YpsA SLOG family